MDAVFYTAAQLAARGSGDIPRELNSSTHLIYSSPATLAFNSPGAEGYGVKRAGLAVPGSVMLIVSPGCCGRNTSAISRMPGYENRFFYLTMNETDLVTGRHLKKIPDAVSELCRGLEEKGRLPRVVMICITCVDALLGTDMERVCRRAQERVPGVRVRPCYMYALTREGRKPPMVHVRQSIYELLEPRKKRPSSVNLLGFFAPLSEESELPAVLSQAGVRTVRQIGACRDYDSFQEMAEANFNLVLNPEARPAAYDLQKRLGIPFIELVRFYQIDRIGAQYAALGQVLQTTFDDQKWKKDAESAVASFRDAFPDAVFSVGEGMNGNPFELACALVREGFAVCEIFGTVNTDSFVWIRVLAALSPQTRIYSNLHPAMLHYREHYANSVNTPESSVGKNDGGKPDLSSPVTITIGRDAGWYHPGVPNVQWITDVQPFGYGAVTALFNALSEAMRTGSRGGFSPEITLGEKDGVSKNAPGKRNFAADGNRASVPEGKAEIKQIRGFRRYTTPFAPDQSGAVSVLYDMGGISVVCDAGGCTGNICGFDEPRWFEERSAVFSAGLRDMDAILGRDDRLVEKLAVAAQQIPAQFAAVIGTPVPAVIGTDYRALCRMAEKKTGLPVLGISTDGMEYYDRGIEKTFLALLDRFCKKKDAESGAGGAGIGALRQSEDGLSRRSPDEDADRAVNEACRRPSGPGRTIGVWGFTPLDFAGILTADELKSRLYEQGYDKILCCGAGTDIEALKGIAKAEKNLVVSPSGTTAALWLEKEYGIPWEYGIPGEEALSEYIYKAISGFTDSENRKTFSDRFDGSVRTADRGKVSAALSPDPAPLCDTGQTGSIRKVLIVHQQVLADRIRRRLEQSGIYAETAGFFMMNKDLMNKDLTSKDLMNKDLMNKDLMSKDLMNKDLMDKELMGKSFFCEKSTLLREEADLRALVIEKGFDYVVADRALEPVLAGLNVRLIHLPHFAVSGDHHR